MKTLFLIVFGFINLGLFAQTEAITVDPTGNVGIGTDTPQAQLDVNGDGNFTGNLVVDGYLMRRAKIATGIGPSDQTDNGQIVSRVLTFTKAYDDTAIRIGYNDNLRVYSASHSTAASRWEIRIDGQSIPGGELIYDLHTNQGGNNHIPTSIFGYAIGLSAGTYEIQVWVTPISGYYGDAYTGWTNSRWTIEAEEFWVQ